MGHQLTLIVRKVFWMPRQHYHAAWVSEFSIPIEISTDLNAPGEIECPREVLTQAVEVSFPADIFDLYLSPEPPKPPRLYRFYP